MLRESGWSEQSFQTQRQWLQQPMQQELERTQSMWMLQHIITLHLVPQLQDQFVVPTSLAFNADQGITSERTVLTTIVLTATGQPLVIINQSVLSESAGYAKRRDTLSQTALLTMTGTITTSSRMRDMLGTELVT